MQQIISGYRELPFAAIVTNASLVRLRLVVSLEERPDVLSLVAQHARSLPPVVSASA